MFWLYEWLDDRGITSVRKADKTLRQPKELAALHDRASAEPYTTEPLEGESREALLGGRGVDLSGELDCFAWKCRRRQVDVLLSRVWHYFDRVVAVGPSAFRVQEDLEKATDAELLHERLLGDIRLLLHIRAIGAEDLLTFRQKPPACEIHVEQHAREVGLDPILGRLDQLAAQLATTAQIETNLHDDHYHYVFVHPRFEHTVWGTVWPEDDSNLSVEVAKAVLGRYAAHLTSDVRAARRLGLPLGSTVQMHGELLGLTPGSPTPAQILFNLELPVLADTDIRRLLQLRETEREYFERFRHALRTAATERLSAGGNDAPAVAREIQEDVIDPALRDINVRLRAAADALTAKTKISTPLAAMLTACGVYVGEPLLVTAGVAAAGATVQASFKTIDDRREIRLSDMFFLWQAEHTH